MMVMQAMPVETATEVAVEVVAVAVVVAVLAEATALGWEGEEAAAELKKVREDREIKLGGSESVPIGNLVEDVSLGRP